MQKLKWILLLGGALILVAVVGMGCTLLGTPETTPTPGATQPPGQTRAADWVQTSVSDFESGTAEGVVAIDIDGGVLQLAADQTSGTYTSPVVEADFSFNALVPHWQVDLPGETSLQVAVRYRLGEDAWSPWFELADMTLFLQDGEWFPETPLAMSGGTHFQYRMDFGSPDASLSPIVRAVTLTYLDTARGPTTVQAKAFMMSSRSADGVPQPAVISRQGWGADESFLDWDPEYVPSRRMAIHHTVTTNDYSEEEAAQWVRAIYYYHAVTLGWGDIGYNYLVDRYGNVYEGRIGGPDVVGGHVYSYNYGSTGIAAIGTHGNMGGSVPASAQGISALTELAAWEAARTGTHPLGSWLDDDQEIPNLGGHRDYPPYSTSCPGDELYGQLPALREAVWQRLETYLWAYRVEWLTTTEVLSPTVQAGQTYSVSIGARNKGSLTWLSGFDHPVRLGYHWLDGAGRPVVQAPEDDHRTPLSEDVPFGSIAKFDGALVTVPDTPGTYTLAWDLVHEQVAWFHDAEAGSPLLKATIQVVEHVGSTPTPTPTPPPASQAIRNGGFEVDGGWTIYETASPARLTGDLYRSGARALQTGIKATEANVYTYSSAEQAFVVPAGGGILHYWYRADIAAGDHGYVLLQPQGLSWQLLLIVKQDVAGWTEAVTDLTAYAGQRVTLRFGTYNDGRGGVSACYVDDVSLDEKAVSVMPTPEPTATPSPTPSPTPTPAPACLEQVSNGSFEQDGSWTIPYTPYSARYTTEQAYAGQRALQVGIDDPGADVFSYSSAEQQITVPAGRRATLRLWYHMPARGGDGDYGYVLLLPAGGSWRVLRIVREVTGSWTPLEVDLSHYAGQTLTLRFGVRNDGLGDGATAVMYVDGMSVEACVP